MKYFVEKYMYVNATCEEMDVKDLCVDYIINVVVLSIGITTSNIIIDLSKFNYNIYNTQQHVRFKVINVKKLFYSRHTLISIINRLAAPY